MAVGSSDEVLGTVTYLLIIIGNTCPGLLEITRKRDISRIKEPHKALELFKYLDRAVNNGPG
jgi:hypothetical protein